MRAGPNFLWRSGDRLSGGLTAETGPSSRAPSSADFSSTYRTEVPAGFLMANLLSESQKHALLNPYLNERQRRLVAAADARFLGHGGIATLARATGLSRTTLHKAVRELEGNEVPPERVRKAGGGRKSKAGQDPGLVNALERLVDPATRGDPMSPLRWSSKSTAKLAEELCRQGYTISARTVADMLKDQDYSLQANRKTREGSSHPDRDAQFQYINEQTKAFQQRGAPVVS